MTLTPFDIWIIDTLRLKLRLLSTTQLLWAYLLAGGDNERAFSRRLARLVSAGLLAVETLMIRALLQVSLPLVRWEPGMPVADFRSLAWVLERRMRDRPPAPEPVYFVTERALRIFGGCAPGRIANPAAADHDIQTSQLYLMFLVNAPERAALWRSEEEDPHEYGVKVPDAILCSGDQELLAIEWGGLYPQSRLQSLHDSLATRNNGEGLAYEIW